MDDVKNQFKGLVKKFTTSSPKFKGEGHRLGSVQESSQRPAQGNHQPHHADVRNPQQERWAREPTSRQDRSSISTARSSEREPSNLSKRGAPNDAVPTARIVANGTSNDIVKDRFSRALNASNAQNGIKSQVPTELHETKSLDQAGTDSVNSTRNETKSLDQTGMDSANSTRNENLPSHEHDWKISSTSETSGVPLNKLKVQSNEHENTTEFNAFSSHIGSLSAGTSMSEIQMFQCPVCGGWWKSEAEVNVHVDECLGQSTCTSSDNTVQAKTRINNDKIKVSLGVFLSGGPSNESKNVFLRILRNIVNNPDVEKFRKIRLSNPKIHDTVGMALGGMELLEAVGFILKAEEEEAAEESVEEVWAVMDPPSQNQINALREAAAELEKSFSVLSKTEISSEGKPVVQRKVDRQVRVFFAAPESLAAKIELPDSFYQLSLSELRQEATARKKMFEDSEILVSRVSRDRIASANKRKYKAAIIRIQFPDGVVLQGTFLPWELTTAIYEFVSASLRDPGIQFTLVAPGASRKGIPAFGEGQVKTKTLLEADLVPASLVKFQCVESISSPFTGLHPDILTLLEPLSSVALP